MLALKISPALWTLKIKFLVRAPRPKRKLFAIMIGVPSKSDSLHGCALQLDKLEKAKRNLLIPRPNIMVFKQESWIKEYCILSFEVHCDAFARK
jgi:hypothetical protein